MADVKISALTPETTPLTTDQVVIERGGTSNFRTSVANLLTTSHNHSTTEITTGTLPVARGGTGVTSSTGTGNTVLSTSPTLVTPVLGTPTSGTLTNATGLPLTTGVTGALPEANGGTNQSTYTTGDILYSDGANSLAKLPAGTNGQVLTQAAGIPSWAAAAGGGFWELAGSTTLGAASTTLDVTTTGLKKYWMAQTALQGSAAMSVRLRFNSDSAANYVRCFTADGGAATKGASRTEISITGAARTDAHMLISGINIQTEEKLITFITTGVNVGNSTNLTHCDGSGKWVNTADLVTSIQLFSTVNMNIGSEMVVFHHD